AVGYSSIVWFIVLSVLRSIPVSILGVMLFLFTPDCAEYGKFKSGIEAKGITFSIQTFMVKLTAAISAAIPMFILGLSGWVSVNVNNFDELARSGVTQTPHALSVLWFLYVLLPAIGYLIAYFIWRFYDLNDHDVQVMTDCNAGKITREEAECLLSKKY
ncbi:MAG: MFS transporter, partial [Acutalibacteraceae bacterium]